MESLLKKLTTTYMRKASRVRVLDQATETAPEPHKRAFLRTVAAYGGSLPAAYFLFGEAGSAAANTGLGQPVPATNAGTGTVRIVRDFTDARFELVRLLREAAEIEHALMIQYLYGAFSIKPAYQELIGYGNPNGNDLLGVAIEEMQHLAVVNELLVELGAAPVLVRQDFPYEPDIYPFPLNLEPLSRESLAKYTYTEAPASALDKKLAKSAHDRLFIENMEAVLGASAKPNHIGSLYSRVIDTLHEFARQDGGLHAPDRWIAKLEEIKDEGEDGHFKFFKSVFMGTHKAFNGRHDIWHLPKSNVHYPVLPAPTNPSAYVGHENQISDPVSLSIAWLGNLHYWLLLMLLDYGYRHKSTEHKDAAKLIMMGPFWAIARFLPTKGNGMPYDQLSMGYSIGVNEHENAKFLSALAREIEALEGRLKRELPDDYPAGVAYQALATIPSVRAEQTR